MARGALARGRRRRHRGGDRRRDPLRRRAAVGGHGHVPHLPDRRRRGGHAPLPGPVRAGAASCRGAGSPTSPSSPTSCVDRLVAQSDAQAAGRTTRELERLRDDCLVSLLQGAARARRRRGRGARRYERALFAARRRGARATPPRRRDRGPAAAARRGGAARVGRLQRPRAREPLPAGVRRHDRRAAARDRRRRRLPRRGRQLLHRRDAPLPSRAGARGRAALHVETQLLGHDEKRLHVFHALHRTDDGALVATAEQMLLHVDTAAEPRRARRARRCSPASRGSPRPTPRCRARAIRPPAARAITPPR